MVLAKCFFRDTHLPWWDKFKSEAENKFKKSAVEPPVSGYPKCQALVVAYESSDHIGLKFCLIW